MFNKLLILSASAGAGHIRAAQALEQATLALNAAKEVIHIDTLEYTNKVFRNLYSKAYIEMVNSAPEVLGWLYDHLDTPWKRERRRLAIDKLNTRPFVKFVKKYEPDAIICTHFLPAEILSWMKAKEKLHCPQGIVITDFDAHALWLCHNYEHYFVALEETSVHLNKLGIWPSKISVTGIPIDPVFSQHKDKQEMRIKYGLHPDKPTILISAGGFGVGPIELIMRALLQSKHPLQIIAICGKSKELKQQMDSFAASLPLNSPIVVKPIGYTKDMDEYMSASDILLGKPGGLTTSEALTKGLVFVIFNPIPGQEERNSDHLLENSVAIRCNNLPTLAYKLDRLLDDKERFRTMQNNARKLACPSAAYEIVKKMLSLK
ncbi:MAG: glycosyltransferase [Acidobacteria bacterium]|nr:glycosyltransferase [Acidobacteriota bacterium]